jgi:hypothetical protein
VFLKGKFSSSLTRSDLISLRSRALRRGVWFRVLGKVERSLVDLAIRIVHQVRNPMLYKALVSIVNKLEDSFDDRVSRAIRTIGFPSAQRLSLLAQQWGNKSARNWMFDLSYARFIAIMHVNGSALSPC